MEAIINLGIALKLIFEQMFHFISMNPFSLVPVVIILLSNIFMCISGIQRSKRARRHYEKNVYDTCEMASNIVDIANCAANIKSRKG